MTKENEDLIRLRQAYLEKKKLCEEAEKAFLKADRAMVRAKNAWEEALGRFDIRYG